MTRLLPMRSRSELVALIVALAVMGLIAGCGGGDNGGGVTPPPTTDTATVRGTVVAADSVTTGLAGATIQALGVSTASVAGVSPAQTAVLAETTADAHGDFVLNDVPVGNVTIVADTLNEASYGSQSIPGLHLNRDDEVQLTITVLPVGSAVPTVVNLSPKSATTDLHGQIKFNGSVSSSSGTLSVTPSYYLTGEIGVVDQSGQFTATQAGTGRLWAVCGTARTYSTITVTGPRAPQVTSFFVSPKQLSAAGGKVNVTVAANDGDGIAQVRMEVYNPDGSITNVMMELDPRTLETYQLPETTDGLGGTGRWFIVPANTNTPDAFGHQESQRYSLRVIVSDNSGASKETDFVDVVVHGIDTPPPPV